MPIAEAPHKCICQICTCGRHRCPHRPGTTMQYGSNGEKTNGASEYHERYADNGAMPKREALRRAKDNIAIPTDRLDDLSTTRTDYNAPQKSERQGALRNSDNLRPEGNMDMSTNYRNEYEGKQTDRGRAIRNKDNLGNSSAKFDGSPSYRDHYQMRSNTRQPLMKRSDELGISGGAMNLATTHQSDYKENKSERARMNRPPTATRFSGDFDGETTHKDVYRGLPGDRQKNFKPNSMYEPSAEPFDGYTTNRSDFTAKQGSRTRGARPGTSSKFSGENYGTESTMNSNYQPWKTQRREVHRPINYVKPEGDMDLLSVTKNDYGDHKGERAKMARPNTSQKNSGNFYGGTTHKLDYQQWNTDRTRPIAQGGTQLFDNSPLDGTTSYRSHYLGHSLGGPCPAEGLHGENNGNNTYKFKNLIGGHHFFSPLSLIS